MAHIPSAQSSGPTTGCPACGGPPQHPGICTDHDGYVLPAYESLARLWDERGRPALSVEELTDLDELLDQWEQLDDHRAE